MIRKQAANLARHVLRLPSQAARGLVFVYRVTLSPLVGYHCRHLPTCSQFADEALARHGLWAGGWMTFGRLCRCRPGGTSGLDPVPPAIPPEARFFLPWRYARFTSVEPWPQPPPDAGFRCEAATHRDESSNPPPR